jgi:hypothetical protein
MNSLVFDHDGSCLCAMNYEVYPEDYPSAAKVLHLDVEHNPNDVWYDFEKDRLDQKTPFEEVITTNTVSNLPVGTVVEVADESIVVDDGVFELEVTMPQTVYLSISHVRHHRKFLEVACEAQA